jgi:hypothetical protein
MDGNINTLFTNLATTIRNVSVAISVFAFMWGAIQSHPIGFRIGFN